MRTLYLCYFGLREPLVQTQVLPYLRRLAAGGFEVHLLTFEPNLWRAWSPEEEETSPPARGWRRGWRAVTSLMSCTRGAMLPPPWDRLPKGLPVKA